MAKGDLSRLIDHLDRLMAEPDDRLLTQFIATRDESAFAAIVRRHGPMVFGVCRRLLRHEQDAEDCFQATFIILARKASAVVKRASLASWLYAVATRTAQHARALSGKRQARENQMEDLPHPAVADEEPQDWRPILDEELGRLPEKYRAVVVLCELEGRPRQDAAKLLGIPEGTLSSRLATARKILAGRLAGGGLAVSAGGLAAVLAGGAASAAVPASLVAATSKAAVLAAAGQLTVTASTAAVLTHEVMKAMFMTKLKAAVMALVTVVTLGAMVIASRMSYSTAADAPPDKKPPSELEALRRENELLKLNLRVTLEKLEAMEAAMKGQGPKTGMGEPVPARPQAAGSAEYQQFQRNYTPNPLVEKRAASNADAQHVLKAYLNADNKVGVEDAIKVLEDALARLRQQKRADPRPKPEAK